MTSQQGAATTVTTDALPQVVALVPRWVCTHATRYAWSVSATWREGALRAGRDTRRQQELRLSAVQMYATDRARQPHTFAVR